MKKFLIIASVIFVSLFLTMASSIAGKKSPIDPHLWSIASKIIEKNKKSHISNKSTMILIDFTKPSTQRRLFIIDTNTNRILLATYVAHGTNSGKGIYTTSFSNTVNSLQTSLGVFQTLSTYIGKHGTSLRIRGLERGFNDNAEIRSVVIHGASYIGNGQTGHSWGCFAVPSNQINTVINLTKNGSLILAYYPDKTWLAHSKFAN